jgi:predicted O-methyltransferase YrrM
LPKTANRSAERRWAAVDCYIGDLFISDDHAWALKAAKAAGLPSISVSAPQGRLLFLLARAVGARRILELGTLAGYSSIWLARSLPRAGRLVTLELLERHAAVARRNFARARVGPRIDLRVGPALDLLRRLHTDRRQRFDFIFIDADKANYPEYFAWALKLARPGALIVADNVIRDGAVINTRSKDEAVRGVRRFNRLIARERRVSATQIQTVGAKGYDGFALVLVKK